MCSPILQDADLSLRDRGWQHSKEVRHSFFIMSVYVPSAKVCDRPSWSQCGKRPYKSWMPRVMIHWDSLMKQPTTGICGEKEQLTLNVSVQKIPSENTLQQLTTKNR